MKTKLIIARHGNTFKKGETPTRVGGRTDMPLVEHKKSKNIGKYLKTNNLIPDIVFVSPLIRTIQTAMYAMKEIGTKEYTLKITEFFREIDYGVDENKTENIVELRLGNLSLRKKNINYEKYTCEAIRAEGKKIIQKWNEKAIVPDGWNISPNELIKSWITFGKRIEKEYFGKNILVITSNGIARFSPHITVSFDDFATKNNLKISTGAICIFEKNKNTNYWENIIWNMKN